MVPSRRLGKVWTKRRQTLRSQISDDALSIAMYGNNICIAWTFHFTVASYQRADSLACVEFAQFLRYYTRRTLGQSAQDRRAVKVHILSIGII